MEQNKPETNKHLFTQLMNTDAIRINNGAIFNYAPNPKSSSFDFDRIEGMLLGVAIGDGLGITTESKLPEYRRRNFGEIRDYLPNKYTGEKKGFPSDDTQLTFWTLAQLIEDGEFVPENVALKFSNSGKIFGIGSNVREFLSNRMAGKIWYESGPESAGNGALMRIAPMIIPHLRTGGNDIWTDVCLSAMMTHNDFASTSACLTFSAMLWELLDMNRPPEPEWWVSRYVELAADLEGETRYSPRGGNCMNYSGPLWRFINEKVMDAYEKKLPLLSASDGWYSGAFLMETLPCVLYILMCYAHDPEEALVRAVNDTKDNDTIAAIVGAAIGALHGKDGFPSRWITGLTGRTSIDDDGKVFRLIQEAKEIFG